jgi:hypothetical protein
MAEPQAIPMAIPPTAPDAAFPATPAHQGFGAPQGSPAPQGTPGRRSWRRGLAASSASPAPQGDPAAPAAPFAAAVAPPTATSDLRGEALAELSVLAGRRGNDQGATRAAANSARSTQEAEALRKRLTSLAQAKADASEGGTPA